jgi:DNA-binding MarR family transcriptional regulator
MEDYIVIYAVVPKHIYETKLLTPEEKLIAERIIYLCKKEGYCWITNKRLSEMYNITIETASRHIKKLEKIGLIKCIYDHNDKNTKRIIQLVDDIWDWFNNVDSMTEEQIKLVKEKDWIELQKTIY